MNDWLTIAIPKGRLGMTVLEILAEAGLPIEAVATDSRTLMFEFEAEKVRYLICRSSDVPTFVEYGSADIGVVGKDTLAELDADVFEILDLGFGRCRFAVAVKDEVAKKHTNKGIFKLRELNNQRVATKFPNVAEEFFSHKGMQMEVIKLHGNVELAACVGLADMIIDIVSTGKTLQENGLTPVIDIFSATARLIANRVSYRMKNTQINSLSQQLRLIMAERNKHD
ncbi:MAG: ATP phosphoribosyltransferase [Clostridia bacterium]